MSYGYVYVAQVSMGAVRYDSLAKAFQKEAEELFNKIERDAKERLENYKRLANKE